MKHNLYNMKALDIYLSSLSKTEYKQVSNKVFCNSRIKTPLMSWDIVNQDYKNKLQEAQREQDIIKVKSLAKKKHWLNDMDSIFENEAFEAIIITDINQNIIWVNKGFTKMTGYSKVEALNKTPRFLQGGETSNASKKKIRNKLKECLPFKEVVTNYKKDGQPYKCEVKIFALNNSFDKTHFIALERQVS